MRKIILSAMIFIFAFVTVSFAETTIKAEVDKTILTTDDTLTYKIIITSSENNIPVPEIPDLKSFSVLSQARSSTVTFTKGKLETMLAYVFILAPLETGKLKIGPSTIKIKQKSYSSDSFEVEVKQGEEKPKAPVQKKQPSPEESLPESEEPQFTL